jgi:hypothetical protein
MKKIKELVNGRLGKYVIFLLLAYPGLVAAQIGYRYVRGTGTAGELVCWSNTSTLEDCGTGTLTIDGDITLGTNDVDDIVLNGPVTYKVLLESFDFLSYVTANSSWAGITTTDTAENYMFMPLSPLGMIGVSFEQTTTAFVPFSVAGEFDISGIIEVTSQEGVDLTIGGPISNGIGSLGVTFDEDNSASTYCEIGVRIGTVANIDHMHFGWKLAGLRADPGALPDNNNTWVAFSVSDNAGDLDIETELNAGGILNDDTGVTWTDGQTKVLRVTLLADTVTFTLDGTAVTQTNAVLNLDATDQMVCMFGQKQSAAAADANVAITYAEIGISQ